MDAEISRFPLILLAGGKASRLGIPKGLVEIHGKPWIDHQIRKFEELGGKEVLLVLGFGPEAYEKLDLFRAAGVARVEKVLNPDPEHGPFSSIQAGARRVLELNRDGAFVLPIDVPVAEGEVWTALTDALRPGVRACQPIFQERGHERGGHPALLSRAELQFIADMRPSERLDSRIHQLKGDELQRVRVKDSTILLNLNTPAEWSWFKEESRAVEEIGKGAAILSLVEIGLGSLLHAFHIPTAGHWLSLNQAFWLSRTTFALKNEEDARFAPMTLSNVTASLKSLSPAGKRLTPMLAISAQGALFNLGTLALGRNLPGAVLGAVLLSFWAFLQPVAIYYVIFGNTLIQAGAKFFQKTQELFHFSDGQALEAVVFVLSMKALLAITVVILAKVLPQYRVDRYRRRLITAARRNYLPERTVVKSPVSGALHDLFQPLFFVSLALTVVFFFWVESSKTQLIWALIRPLAVGFILFFLVRILPPERVLAYLETRGFRRFAAAFRVAKASLRERQ